MLPTNNTNQTSKGVTDDSPEPPPNITPETKTNEGKRKKKVSFVSAGMIDDPTDKKRYEILVEQRSTPTLQTAVKKTVAILMAQASMTVYPHSTVTLRNPVNKQEDFPIEETAIKDYVFDTGTEFRNGQNYYKASFIGYCKEPIQALKRKGLLSILRQKKIFIQEFESTEVFESTEIGFLCNLPPNYCARGQIVEELKYFLKGELGKDIKLKAKLASRFFGSKKEGLVKSQYLALYAETEFYQEAGECIGEALEDNIILQKWGNVKLLPTRPTLHEKFNKEKFFQILQIHNEAIQNTKRIAIRNIWVGDHVLPNNDALLDALFLPKDRDYTLRELILESATENEVELKDMYSNGHMAFIICDSKNYTRCCEFIDYLIEQCKQHYGEVQFAQLVKSCDPYDRHFHPRRSERPVFTSQRAVQNMIKNVNPGIKLLKKKEIQQRVYTSHKQEKSWKSVVIATTAHEESQTSPLTSDTNSKIESLKQEVQNLKDMLFEEKKNNMVKYEIINKSVDELKNEVRGYRAEQAKLLQTVRDAVESMKESLKEIKKTNERVDYFEQIIQNKHNENSPMEGITSDGNSSTTEKSSDVRTTEKMKRSYADRILEEDNLSPIIHKPRSQLENKNNENKRVFMKHGHSMRECHVNK